MQRTGMDAWIGPLSSHIGIVTACLLLASFVIAFRPLPQAKNCLWPVVFQTPRRSVSIAPRLWKHPHHCGASHLQFYCTPSPRLRGWASSLGLLHVSPLRLRPTLDLGSAHTHLRSRLTSVLCLCAQTEVRYSLSPTNRFECIFMPWPVGRGGS
jgi:hypothetical protein